MLEQALRGPYQRLFVNHIARLLSRYIKPNTMTIIGGITGFLIAPALGSDWINTAIILLLISGYCDSLDGTIARYQQLTSSFGSLLDILTDRFVEFMIVFGLWLVQPDQRSLMCILMLGSILLCVTSFLLVGIFSQNNSHKSFYYSPGIMERPEAFLFFILMMKLPQWFHLLAGIFCLLVIITTIRRAYEFYQAEK